MFGRRALSIQLIKAPPNNETPDVNVTATIDPEQLHTMLKDQVKNVALVVGAVIATRTVLNTASEIAIITAKAKIR